MPKQQATLQLNNANSRAARSTSTFPAWRLFWPKNPTVEDTFLRELISCRPVQRLRRIRFLGAIDYLTRRKGSRPLRRRHSRFDHSVNVALLAVRFATHRCLNARDCRVIAAAALLHDVGHGPLSHSLEPIFSSLFDIDHHEAGKAIIRGQSPLGGDIPRICSHYKVDLDEVLALLEGHHSGSYAFLFSSPINLDTIEAIARCCQFASSGAPVSPPDLVDAISTEKEFPVGMTDRFWSVKEKIYRTLIHSRIGTLADGFAQQYMWSCATDFDMDDFYLDDPQLRRKHSSLFGRLRHARQGATIVDGSRADLLAYEVGQPRRSFTVNRFVAIHTPKDLARRYTQMKDCRRTSIGSLMRTARTNHQIQNKFELELCLGQESTGCDS